MHKPPNIGSIPFHNHKEYIDQLGYIGDQDREVLALVTLSPDRRMIKKRILTVGGFHSSTFDLQLLFHRVIYDKAYYFIIAHNHPNGMGVFSQGDVLVSIKIMMMGELLGIQMYDHLLFPYNRACCTSLKTTYPKLFAKDYNKIFVESIVKHFPKSALEIPG